MEAKTKWLPFPDDIFKPIFFNDNRVRIKISLKYVPTGPLVQAQINENIRDTRH